RAGGGPHRGALDHLVLEHRRPAAVRAARAAGALPHLHRPGLSRHASERSRRIPAPCRPGRLAGNPDIDAGRSIRTPELSLAHRLHAKDLLMTRISDSGFSIAIVGATGQVGTVMRDILAE